MRTFLRWFSRQSTKLTKEGVLSCVGCTIVTVAGMYFLPPGWAVILGTVFLVLLFLTLMKL